MKFRIALSNIHNIYNYMYTIFNYITNDEIVY